MSRSGYSEDGDEWATIRWRGAVASAIRGKRGQAFLREMLVALDAMPQKKLIRGELKSPDGVCALGCVGRSRRLDMRDIDPEDREHVADIFGISLALAAEIAFENDEGYGMEVPERRFDRMRRWVVEHIKSVETPK